VPLSLLDEIKAYCKKYDVPPEYLIRIIDDPKVVPMIRGKAVEFNVYLFLKQKLPSKTWQVEKRDMNAQPGHPDQDVLATHLPTKTTLTVECKSAVRNSFRLSSRNEREPHFQVKCHRSRSYMGKPTNDRYLVGDFDVVVTNPSNAFILEGTEEDFAVTHDKEKLEALAKLYGSMDPDDILTKSYADWFFAVPEDIAVRGVVPRTPVVRLFKDPNWGRVQEAENMLLRALKNKSQGRAQKLLVS
jgi:hypothetical protein